MFNRDKDNLNKDDLNGENCHLVEYTNIVIEGIEKRKKEVCLNFSLLLLLFIGIVSCNGFRSCTVVIHLCCYTRLLRKVPLIK